MKPSGCPPSALEERGIQQESAAIGKRAEMPGALLPAQFARDLALPARACRAGVEVQVTPEIFEFLPPPIEEFGEPAIEFHAEMIGERGILRVWSKAAVMTAFGGRAVKAPRQVAFEARHHGQQCFPVDALDEFAVTCRMSDQGVAAVLLRVAADEACRETAAIERGGHTRSGFLRGEGDIFAGIADGHSS